MKHCIKSIPAADLEVVAFAHVFDCGPEEGRTVELEILNKELRESATFDTNGWRCDCCGHSVSYCCEVVHKPTRAGYYVGRQCAANLQELARHDFGRLSVALAQRAKSRRAVNAWLKANPQHADIVAWAKTAVHYIASDIARKLARYGSISEGQVNLLYKLKTQVEERAAAQAAEPVPTTPAPEGRLTVTGTILGLKTKDTPWGISHKMLVRLTDANKVWTTVPANFDGGKGDSITFTATFERSKDDQHFAFGSRPHFKAPVEAAA